MKKKIPFVVLALIAATVSFIFLPWLCSCSVRQKVDGEIRLQVTGLNKDVSPSVSELFSSIQVIPLETQDSCLLMNVEKVVPCKDGYFVFDNLRPALYLFDKSGKFVREIGRKGNGPGEFQLLADFMIDEKEGRITLLSQYGFLLEYDWNGNYLDKITLPVKPNYYSVASLDDGQHWALWSCVDTEEDGIGIVDRHSHALVNGYWNNDRMLDMDLMRPFYSYNGNVYFGSAYQPQVYRLEPDSLVCAYSWDFGADGVDGKLLEGYAAIENSGERNRKKLQDLKDGILPYGMECHAQNSRYYYVALRSGFGMHRPFKNVFYEKQTGRSFIFEKMKEGISIQTLFLAEDYLLSVLPYEEVSLYKELLGENEYAKVAGMKEDDNMCLVKFVLK